MTQRTKNILIPRFDTFGDIILLEGFLERVIDRHPGANITMLVRSGYDQLAPMFPANLQWITTDLHPYKQFDNAEMQAAAQLLATINNTSWDLLIISTFNRTWIDELIISGTHSKFTVVLGDTLRHERLLRKIATELAISPDRHIDKTVVVDEKDPEGRKYQALSMSFFDDPHPIQLPSLSIPQGSQETAGKIQAGLGINDRNYVVCLPGGLQNTAIKGWPLARYAEIIEWITSSYHYVPLLVGHQSEIDLLTSVKQHLERNGVPTLMWMGSDGELPLLAALMKQARLFIGNDSGPMHIAAAIGIPTVGIFGGGHFQRFMPAGTRSVGIIGDMPCFGCGWDCMFGDAPCVKLVTIADVKNAIGDILDVKHSISHCIARASVTIDGATAKYIRAAKDKLDHLREDLRQAESDRSARLDVILKLEDQLRTNESDRTARLMVIGKLEQRLAEAESDRAVRLEVIQKLEGHLRKSESDRTARLEVIQKLEGQLRESESDRTARLQVINKLEKRLADAESDREVRLGVIENLQGKLRESEADRAARLAVIRSLEVQLGEVRGSLHKQERAVSTLDKELYSLRASWSWRGTALLRWIAHQVKRFLDKTNLSVL